MNQLEQDYQEVGEAVERTVSRLPKLYSQVHGHRNMRLNRYSNILPWDRSRVTLNPPLPVPSSEEKCDYINASFVRIGAEDSAGFVNNILTQGPMGHTAIAFWEMVWQKKSPFIVMLCNFIEFGMSKCYAYFPLTDSTSYTFGSLRVKKLNAEVIFNESTTRTELTLHRLDEHMKVVETRNIQHYHFLDCEDGEVPTNTAIFLDFLHHLNSLRPQETFSEATWPVVHCSAGIGRAGLFVALQAMMVMIDAGEEVYTSTLKHMLINARLERDSLVQTVEQYKFIMVASLAYKNYKERGLYPIKQKYEEPYFVN